VSTAALNTTRQFVEQVWAREPDDIRHLRDTALPPGGRWSGVLFCNLILLWSGQTLGLQRGLALKRDVPLEATTTVVVAELRQVADWLNHWHMSHTCGFLRRVADDLVSDPPATPEALAETIAELLVATNRVQNWIDAFVPWAQLDRRLPPIDGNTAPGQARETAGR
jgi:hypothetical protein